MANDLFDKAAKLFNSGDKKGAEAVLLQIIEETPNDADAWYGLALCAQTLEGRVQHLQKCLAIKPDHLKAIKALAAIEEKKKVQQAVETSNEDKIISVPEEIKPASSKPKLHFSFHWVYSPIFLILVGLVIWQFVRIDKLEKSMVAANEKAQAMSLTIGKMDSDIGSLASAINSVSRIANNANNYAHSHSYSDIRLKTDIVTIKDPLSKLIQLRGVNYRWNTAAFPEMGFEDTLQIGVIAQEIETVLPELVSIDSRGFKQVDYEKLSAVIIEAIKEQQSKISILQNRLDKIEKK
jgi:tetratricopeptide (TPR) repeat protein